VKIEIVTGIFGSFISNILLKAEVMEKCCYSTC